MFPFWLGMILSLSPSSPLFQMRPRLESRHDRHLISTGIVIVAEIVGRTYSRPALQLTLLNQNPYAVLVETGVIVGKVYPVANMTFSLTLEDGKKVELLCDGCAPAGVAGLVAPSSVRLAPGQEWQEEIPMSLFVIMPPGGRADRLDTLNVHHGHLTAGLVVNEPLTSVQGAQQTRIFQGAIRTTISFPLFTMKEKAFLHDSRNW